LCEEDTNIFGRFVGFCLIQVSFQTGFTIPVLITVIPIGHSPSEHWNISCQRECF